VEIELVGLEPDEVARRPSGQHVVRERLAKSRDVHVKGLGGADRHVLTPELVDQPVSGDHVVGVEQKQRQKRARLESAQGHLAAFVPNLERPEDPELHLLVA
jgi:hypothetical protein